MEEDVEGFQPAYYWGDELPEKFNEANLMYVSSVTIDNTIRVDDGKDVQGTVMATAKASLEKKMSEKLDGLDVNIVVFDPPEIYVHREKRKETIFQNKYTEVDYTARANADICRLNMIKGSGNQQ